YRLILPRRAFRARRGKAAATAVSQKFIYERWIVRGPRFSLGRRGHTYNRCLKTRPDKGDRAPYARLRRLEEAPYAHVPIEQRAARVECSALSRSKSHPLRSARLIHLPALRRRDGM